VLGDLVNYGPQPREVVADVMAGQPRTGDTLSRYAIWQDGNFELKSFRYPVAATVEKLRALGLPQPVEVELISILETGLV
jgi:hypothetical protein